MRSQAEDKILMKMVFGFHILKVPLSLTEPRLSQCMKLLRWPPSSCFPELHVIWRVESGSIIIVPTLNHAAIRMVCNEASRFPSGHCIIRLNLHAGRQYSMTSSSLLL